MRSDSDVPWWRRIVVRRERDSPLEIVPATSTPIQVMSWMDGEHSVYGVALPPGAVLIPDDCRRIAYEHDLVRARIGACARDNVADAPVYASEPGFDERLAERLRVALGDLARVFDLAAVQVSGEPEGLRVEIDGAFKNGERTSLQLFAHD